MYCPRCAAQNLDDAKFCRGCGTSLETIALALAGKLPLARKKDEDDDEEEPKTWMEKRRKGVNKLVRATGLLGSSLLIGTALGLFSNQNDWIFVWMVFCGWMAVWGVFSLVSGIQYLLDARYTRKYLGPAARDTGQLSSGREFKQLPERDLSMHVPPVSVTEQTTRALVEPKK